MEYTVRKLAQLAGVSPRTLRYYDEIGILKPARINSSGYRLYGEAEVDRLQQILFYHELGMDLGSVKAVITSPSFDRAKALREHRQGLLERRSRLDLLIANVNKSIAAIEGGVAMSDKEKFRGFIKGLVDENEAKYGAEARRKYGDNTVNASNARVRSMTQEHYNESSRLAVEIQETLRAALKTGDPAGPLAQRAVDLHRQWLSFWWDSYSKEAHAGLAQAYVVDERFTEFYNRYQPGTAAFLRDAILIYTGTKA